MCVYCTVPDAYQIQPECDTLIIKRVYSIGRQKKIVKEESKFSEPESLDSQYLGLNGTTRLENGKLTSSKHSFLTIIFLFSQEEH